MLSTILSDTQDKLYREVQEFKSEIAVIRTGRVTPALVENVRVEAYGSRLVIKELATISVPEANLIIISPWDSQVLENIVAGIRSANLGFNPVVDGEVIKIPVPRLSEERRLEMIKKVGEIAEGAKISVRQVRHEKIKSAEEMEVKGLVSEDDLFSFKEGIQKKIKETNVKIEELRERKEEELKG
ncbi:ribosome recycling factor [Patescibacteria group bacterium]|nr:ribosome recycling factor [Patescibacteria group bacterium]